MMGPVPPSYFKMSAASKSKGLGSSDAYTEGFCFGMQVKWEGGVLVPEHRYPEEAKPLSQRPDEAWFQGFMKGVRNEDHENE